MQHRAASQLAIAAATLCGAILSAQQGSQNPVFRSRVDAIEIEMRALDQRGAPVTDLDRSEVDVFEDGRKQEITTFQHVSIPIAASVEPPLTATSFTPPDVVSNRTSRPSRIFVLVLDDLHVDRRNTAHVKQAARRFVEHYVEPDDLVSVVYTGVRPDAAQDFTSDRRLMLTAIDKFIGRKLPPATIERMEQYNTLFRARGAPRFEDLRDKQDAERAFNARSAMASIETISALLARVTGRRKAALLFSEGVDYDLAGLRTRGRSAPVGPTVLAPTLPTGASETDAMGRADVHSYAHDVLLSIQAAIGAAARANVALYPMDVQGGDTSDSLADLGAPAADPSLGLTPSHVMQEMRDAQETLVVMAENTGGFAALTPSDYENAFGRIVRESSEYYLLAYSPWNPAPDGTYRDISVKVKRPDVQVQARHGYYAPKAPAKRAYRFEAPGISTETSTMVMAPIPGPGLSLDVQTVALRHDAKKAEVVVTTSVDGRQLAGEVPGRDVTNTLEFALMALDSAGKVQDATGRAIDVRLDEASSRVLRNSGYRVVSRLLVPPGRYQIRQAVRERNGGRQGSVFADLEVPDFSSRVSIGGVLLTSTRANAVPTSVDPATYERLPVLPSVRRTYAADEELIAAAEIYQPSGARDVQLTITVSDSSGRERYRREAKVAGREFTASGGSYRCSVQLPLADMDGDLRLTIDARASSDHVATRRAAFTVTPR
jgi:VWFA-related protein